MQLRLLVASWSVCLILAGGIASGAKPAKRDKLPKSDEAASPAAQYVEAALIAESEGQSQRRDELLQQAVNADPQHAAAHWHRGEVLVDGEWLSVDAAMKRTTSQGKIFAYNCRRAAAGSTGADQLALARWCRQEGLTEQHRAHALLALNAGTVESAARLELQMYPVNGIWLTEAEITEFKRNAEAYERALRYWRPRLNRLIRTARQSERSRAAIESIDDPAAIPAMEQLLSVKNQTSAMLAVQALANIKDQRATESLVRHAVLSPWEEVRDAAAAALRPRSLYSYAPLLLAGLQFPIRIDSMTIDQGVGSWSYRCQLFREGPLVDSSLDATYLVQRESTPIDPSDLLSMNRARNEASRMADANNQSLAQVTALAAANAQTLAELNARGAFVNKRIANTLALATAGTEADPAARQKTQLRAQQQAPAKDPDQPRYWWEWWYDHNDIYYTSERPVSRYTDFNQETIRPPTAVECFVSGTPVWTPTGPLAIELVRPGDLVLAQHPETGELAYKAALVTTVRPPTEVLRIEIGGDELIATRGHPLWVSGHGWKMARELVVGDRLHTASGSKEITSIVPAPKAAAYNLVVDGFNTYFAGKARVLAHDNNLRQPSRTVVPGLVASN